MQARKKPAKKKRHASPEAQWKPKYLCSPQTKQNIDGVIAQIQATPTLNPGPNPFFLALTLTRTPSPDTDTDPDPKPHQAQTRRTAEAAATSAGASSSGAAGRSSSTGGGGARPGGGSAAASELRKRMGLSARSVPGSSSTGGGSCRSASPAREARQCGTPGCNLADFHEGPHGEETEAQHGGGSAAAVREPSALMPRQLVRAGR